VVLEHLVKGLMVVEVIVMDMGAVEVVEHSTEE
jgi:hypothetical protein